MRSNIIITIFLAAIFFIFIISFYVFWQNNSIKIDNENSDKQNINKSSEQNNDIINQINPQEQILIRKCPDAWYEDKMPIIVNNPDDPQPIRQYFVIDGQRVETFEVDIKWVTENCEIKEPSIVY